MDKKRLFLALPIEPIEPSAEKMQILKNRLREFRIKWVPAENMHLTLFFFGDVVSEKIPVLLSLIRSALKDSNEFDFAITSPGIFKKQNEPHVLWLGIDAPDALFNLKKCINDSVQILGFETEGTLFKPHLTLGRFVGRQDITPVLQSALQEETLQSRLTYTANKVVLFESKLTSTAPIYSPIEIFNLNKSKKAFAE